MTPRHCRWCAGAIIYGRPDRAWHDGREDEPGCFNQFLLHTNRAVQFQFVVDRDGLRCWDCDAEPMRWKHDDGPCFMGGEIGTYFVDERGCGWARGTRFTRVEYVTALELEHTTPLWRTTHLPWSDRRPYFGPTNLRLRCPACHAPKTKAEASARAKEKRQMKLRLDAPKVEPKRKIQGRSQFQSRGFDKSLTKGINGQIRPRKTRP